MKQRIEWPWLRNGGDLWRRNILNMPTHAGHGRVVCGLPVPGRYDWLWGSPYAIMCEIVIDRLDFH